MATTAPPRLELPSLDDIPVPFEHVVKRATLIAMAMIALLAGAGIAAALLLTMDVTVPASGVIEPLRIWPVRSTEAGIVGTLAVSPGDTVREGQVLVQMDTLEVSAAAAQLRASRQGLLVDRNRIVAAKPFDRERERLAIVDAEAALTRKRASLRERLAEFGMSPNVDSLLSHYRAGTHVALDGATADVLSADAALQSARMTLVQHLADTSDLRHKDAEIGAITGDLDVNEARRRRLLLRAPARGVVLTDNLERVPGSLVHEGDVLLEIADVSNWRATLQVRQEDVRKVRIGDRVVVSIPALRQLADNRINARVASVALMPAATDKLASDYRLTAQLDVADVNRIGVEQLKRGYTVEATIIMRRGRIATIALEHLRGHH